MTIPVPAGKRAAASVPTRQARSPWLYAVGGAAITVVLAIMVVWLSRAQAPVQPPTSEAPPVVKPATPPPVVIPPVKPPPVAPVAYTPLPTSGPALPTSLPDLANLPALTSTSPSSTDAPEQLDFAPAALKLSEGDQWTYMVHAGDSSLDGKTLTVTLSKIDSRSMKFTTQLAGGGNPRPCTLARDSATWLMPTGVARGQFDVLTVGSEMPSRITRGSEWQGGRTKMEYVGKAAVPKRRGTQLAGSGPMLCSVPAGKFACARLMCHDVDGDVQTAAYEAWLSPPLPFAVRCRVPRAKGEGLVFMELQSFKMAGLACQPLSLNVPATERQKLRDWAKSNFRMGRQDPMVEQMLCQFHSGFQDAPGKVLHWEVGSKLTKAGKGCVLEFRNGQFNVVREVDAKDEPPAQADKLLITLQ